MVIGFIYLKFPNFKSRSSIIINNKIIESQQRKVEKRRANTILLQKKIDRLLDKVSDEGFDSLSEDEKDQLYVYSRRIGRDLKKD